MNENEKKDVVNTSNTPESDSPELSSEAPVLDESTHTEGVVATPAPAQSVEAIEVHSEPAAPGTTIDSAAVAAEVPANKTRWALYGAAIVIVVITLLSVLYMLEKDGRSSTNIFGSIIASQSAGTVVAVVNDEEIVNSQLELSMQQFGQAAAAQGVDMNDPSVQEEVRTQSLQVLINTELLRQAAAERGISISDEMVEERMVTLQAEVGGAEVLTQRMAELGIDEDRLEKDVREEMMIQALLDEVFAEANIEITDEEVVAIYEGAGGAEAGLPALEEVRTEVENQIRATKEQEVIDEYLSELEAEAEIEIR